MRKIPKTYVIYDYHEEDVRVPRLLEVIFSISNKSFEKENNDHVIVFSFERTSRDVQEAMNQIDDVSMLNRWSEEYESGACSYIHFDGPAKLAGICDYINKDKTVTGVVIENMSMIATASDMLDHMSAVEKGKLKMEEIMGAFDIVSIEKDIPIVLIHYLR